MIHIIVAETSANRTADARNGQGCTTDQHLVHSFATISAAASPARNRSCRVRRIRSVKTTFPAGGLQFLSSWRFTELHNARLLVCFYANFRSSPKTLREGELSETENATKTVFSVHFVYLRSSWRMVQLYVWLRSMSEWRFQIHVCN